MARTFVIRLTHGPDNVERVGQALTIGSTAIASGVNVEMGLIHDAVYLAQPGAIERLELAHSPPLIELWEAVRKAGRVYACTQCLLRRSIGADELREGVTQGGAAVL